jgi:SAM-dependent methyltransferase
LTGTDLPTVLSEERRIANLWAPHYDAATLSNAYVYRIERSQFVTWVVATLREESPDPRTLSILDAGCGTGDVIQRLSREGFVNLTGLDLSGGMLREARKREVAGARWVEASIEDPPFTREAFDVILACFTLHHLFEPSAFFRLVELSLRPGGWFFILDYDRASAGWGSSRQGRVTRAAGGLARAVFARKNRRELAARPNLPRLFNPAHRFLGFEQILEAMQRPDDYELRRKVRGVLLPALLLVLVEESALDRRLARWAGAVDRRLAPRTGGVFQWVAGRRRS